MINKKVLNKALYLQPWILILILVFVIGIGSFAVYDALVFKNADPVQKAEEATSKLSPPVSVLSTDALTPKPTTDWNNIQWKTYTSPDNKYSFDYPASFSMDRYYDAKNTTYSVDISDMSREADGSLSRDNYLEDNIVTQINPNLSIDTFVLKGFELSISIDLTDDVYNEHSTGNDAYPSWDNIEKMNNETIYTLDHAYRGKENSMRHIYTVAIPDSSKRQYIINALFNTRQPLYYDIYKHLISSFRIL